METNLDKYLKVRELMKPGDCLTWVGNSFLSRIIRKWSKRSHVSSIIGKIQDGKSRCFIIEADQGEVNVRLLSSKIKNYKGSCFLHRLKPEFDKVRPRISDFLWSQTGKKYDYAGLFKNIFGHIKADSDKFICSELTGASYYHETSEKWDLPSGFSSMNILEFIYEAYDVEPLRNLFYGKALRPEGIAKLSFFQTELQVF